MNVKTNRENEWPRSVCEIGNNFHLHPIMPYTGRTIDVYSWCPYISQNIMKISCLKYESFSGLTFVTKYISTFKIRFYINNDTFLLMIENQIE